MNRMPEVGLEPTRLTAKYFEHFMAAYYITLAYWCRKSDSNRHVSRRQLLRLLWLPITSFRHVGPLCKVATSASSLRRDDFFSPTTDKKVASVGWPCPQQPLPFSNERNRFGHMESLMLFSRI